MDRRLVVDNRRMTNHPRRQRPDITGEAERDAAAADALAGELVPAGPGDIPPQGSAEIPAHTGNGVPPGLRANAAKIIGQTVAEAIAQALPQAVYSAFVQALSQVPVQVIARQPLCGTCLLLRITWEQNHRKPMEQAIADACQAAGIEPGSPQAGQLDLAAFLPPELRPGTPGGMPPVQERATTVNGSDLCPMHIPGVQSGPHIMAVPALSGQALAQFARAMSAG
jgi:hypothetical protein